MKVMILNFKMQFSSAINPEEQKKKKEKLHTREDLLEEACQRPWTHWCKLLLCLLQSSEYTADKEVVLRLRLIMH